MPPNGISVIRGSDRDHEVDPAVPDELMERKPNRNRSAHAAWWEWISPIRKALSLMKIFMTSVSLLWILRAYIQYNIMTD
jgi:hypothetical protein